MSKTTKINIITVSLLLFLVSAFSLIPRLHQPSEYYDFADTRVFLNIPNSINVLSNIPYIILGAIGMALVLTRHHSNRLIKLYANFPYSTIFICSVLLGMGSIYYYSDPSHYTLFWMRLPLTIIYMAIMCLLLEDRISIKSGHILLFISVLIGASSVLQWEYTELTNKSDIKFYEIIQFIPFVVSMATLILFPRGFKEDKYWFKIFAWFLIGKIFEIFDYEIFHFTSELCSGHTFKNLASAMSIYYVVKYLSHKGKYAISRD
ncbi:MAG: hypothetical protein J0G32_02495 [Alphaproteobacteria bacterium]|nr:hypothetical protein [Alphaproteobacteria bacterium]OJV12179.1 MAG: hypothetical protein BGO27_05515 [Alphaproteobacteria bacterium 33-17]